MHLANHHPVGGEQIEKWHYILYICRSILRQEKLKCNTIEYLYGCTPTKSLSLQLMLLLTRPVLVVLRACMAYVYIESSCIERMGAENQLYS